MSTTPDIPAPQTTRPDVPTRGPARPLPYAIAGVLIAIAIVMPLAVPMYARADPALWGIPFFYWYQLLWVFIAAGLLGIAYLVMRREDARRRAVARSDRRDAADGGGDR
jgi:predicted membrane protein